MHCDQLILKHYLTTVLTLAIKIPKINQSSGQVELKVSKSQTCPEIDFSGFQVFGDPFAYAS